MTPIFLVFYFFIFLFFRVVGLPFGLRQRRRSRWVPYTSGERLAAKFMAVRLFLTFYDVLALVCTRSLTKNIRFLLKVVVVVVVVVVYLLRWSQSSLCPLSPLPDLCSCTGPVNRVECESGTVNICVFCFICWHVKFLRLRWNFYPTSCRNIINCEFVLVRRNAADERALTCTTAHANVNTQHERRGEAWRGV